MSTNMKSHRTGHALVRLLLASFLLLPVWNAVAVSKVSAAKTVVTFKANGGTGKMAKQTFRRSVANRLSANAFQRKGWVFAGWAKTRNGAVAFSNRQKVANISSSKAVTLYARWAKPHYQVRFKPNGGKGTMKVESFTYGESKKLSRNRFTRTGYIFLGWAKRPTGAVAYSDEKKVKNLTMKGGTVTLYAVWKVHKVVPVPPSPTPGNDPGNTPGNDPGNAPGNDPGNAPGNDPSITNPALIYYCTFDSTNAIQHPEVGPGGAYLGGEFVEGRKGKSLLSFADEPSAEVSLPVGMLGASGTIEFWAKLEGNASAASSIGGGIPRFFGLWLFTSESDPGLCSTHLQFTTNDGMGMSGLCGMVYSCALATESTIYTAPYSLLNGAFNEWHHYAMTWDIGGLPDAKDSESEPVVIALYLDGNLLQTQGRKSLQDGQSFASIPDLQAKLAFPTPSSGWNSSAQHVAFCMDEFKIWNGPRSQFDITQNADPSNDPGNAPGNDPSTTNPALIYYCTFDSTNAIQHPEVGPGGAYLGGEFVEGRKGKSLLSFADEPSAEVSLPVGMLGASGTIEFWAKLEGNASAASSIGGGIPRFFGLWLFTSESDPGLCSTHLQFTTNDGMGMSGLCGMVYSCALATESTIYTAPYSLLNGAFNEWHHYAMTWDIGGLPDAKDSESEPVVIALYLDGNLLQTQGRKSLQDGQSFASIPDLQAKLAFPTPSSGWNSSAQHVAFCMDEFKIWNGPRSQFDITQNADPSNDPDNNPGSTN